MSLCSYQRKNTLLYYTIIMCSGLLQDPAVITKNCCITVLNLPYFDRNFLKCNHLLVSSDGYDFSPPGCSLWASLWVDSSQRCAPAAAMAGIRMSFSHPQRFASNTKYQWHFVLATLMLLRHEWFTLSSSPVPMIPSCFLVFMNIMLHCWKCHNHHHWYTKQLYLYSPIFLLSTNCTYSQTE